MTHVRSPESGERIRAADLAPGDWVHLHDGYRKVARVQKTRRGVQCYLAAAPLAGLDETVVLFGALEVVNGRKGSPRSVPLVNTAGPYCPTCGTPEPNHWQGCTGGDAA